MAKVKNRISLVVQEGVLKSYFPGSRILRKNETNLLWEYELTPTPLSRTYKVKLTYSKGVGVKFYVLEPNPLPKAPGETFLPHVYSTAEQRLCLYYPKDNEWTPNMLFAKTIIPWACEWLLHYELWVMTGKWHGGGIEHNTDSDKVENESNEEK